MKRLILIMVVFMTTISVFSQEQDSTTTATAAVPFRYGVISYEKVLSQTHDYLNIDADLAVLKANFDAEMQAAEKEFNAKYETFLAEQKNYAPAILRKRQTELEDMMRRNEQFRLESLRLLEQARVDLLKPIRERIGNAIASVAQLYQLAFVLNTDSDAVPYLNKSMAYDVTDLVTEVITSGLEEVSE